MPLPENVFRVFKPRGRILYYWQAGRTKPKAERSKCVRIKYDPRDPREAALFFAEAARLNGAPPASDVGTFKAAIEAFQKSPEWTALAASTRGAYSRYLGYMAAAYGPLKVAAMTASEVVDLRDKVAIEISANTANQCLKAWSAFIAWCIPRKLIDRNPVRDVPSLDHDAEITPPWPEHVWRAVVDHGGERLKRLAILGRATGQRISDLRRMRPADRKHDGILVNGRITKTKARHWCALSQNDLATIDRWTCEPMKPYLDGVSEQIIGRDLSTFLAERGLPKVTAHGLRSMAVCDARVRGVSHQEIAAMLGMSLAMVMRYSTHIDQELAARSGRARMDASGTSVKTNVKTLEPGALKRKAK